MFKVYRNIYHAYSWEPGSDGGTVTRPRVRRRGSDLSVSGRDLLFSTRPRKAVEPTKPLLVNRYRGNISQA
jgi:orotidine-5'-phosphate decarboxylase